MFASRTTLIEVHVAFRVADATGVAFGVRQPGTRVGVEVVRETSAWAVSLPHTVDLEGAQAIYGSLFGWELAAAPGAAFFQWRLADEVIAVVTPTDGIAVLQHWSVNFVQDADAPHSAPRRWAAAC